MNAPAPHVAATIARVRDRLGERLVTTRAVRDAHGRGEGLHGTHPPDAVAFARTTEEVAAVVAACRDHRAPLVPFGTGTSLEGHVAALNGGISLDLSGMDRVLDASAENLDAHVEAGVTREALNAHVRDMGLFFPLDPGANASLGGMAATRASGTNAVRYGTMREVTLGLTVVTPQGEVIRTGGRARKSSSGYDLTRLYVGSEGTLGVITELRLRLFGVPETIAAAVAPFGALADAVGTVQDVLQLGVPVARIELLDALQMRACIAWSRLEGVAAAPTLFLEFHGSAGAVAEQSALVAEVAAARGGGPLAFAHTTEERSRLWRARHEAYHAARGLRPGHHAFSTDACVPVAALADTVAACAAAAERRGLLAPIVGHVGDGNFHMLVLFDAADPASVANADGLTGEVARLALAHGGTVTGEHGVGMHKLEHMAAEHGEALAVMRRIKAALDPLGIMNPGKTVPGEALRPAA